MTPVDLDFRRGDLEMTPIQANERGEFDIRGLAQGGYIWRISANRFQSQLREVQFISDGQTIRDDIALQSAPSDLTLRVHLAGRDGSHIRGGVVYLCMLCQRNGAVERRQVGRAGERGGSAAVSGLVEGIVPGEMLSTPDARYYLQAKAPGYAVHVQEVGETELVGAELLERRLVLDRAPLLTGRVIPGGDVQESMRKTGEPIDGWGCEIQVERVPMDRELSWTTLVQTDLGGTFRIDFLPVGEYRIVDPLCPVSGTFRVPRDTALIIDLEAGIIR